MGKWMIQRIDSIRGEYFRFTCICSRAHLRDYLVAETWARIQLSHKVFQKHWNSEKSCRNSERGSCLQQRTERKEPRGLLCHSKEYLEILGDGQLAWFLLLSFFFVCDMYLIVCICMGTWLCALWYWVYVYFEVQVWVSFLDYAPNLFIETGYLSESGTHALV